MLGIDTDEAFSLVGLNPLKGFMNKKDFLSVIYKYKYKNSIDWPMPIFLNLNKNKLYSTYELIKLQVKKKTDKKNF